MSKTPEELETEYLSQFSNRKATQLMKYLGKEHNYYLYGVCSTLRRMTLSILDGHNVTKFNEPWHKYKYYYLRGKGNCNILKTEYDYGLYLMNLRKSFN